MRLRFWGAAGEVTGSCHLLEVGGKRLMLDGGLHQGRRKESYERNRERPCKPVEVDAVVLSHAHLDHSGNLPTWVKNGYRNRIYSTPATRDLCALMLRDSAHIQEQDVVRVNRKRIRQGQKAFEPLYSDDDAVATLRRFVTFDYDEAFEPIPGVRAHFVDAGHMLGSASVVLDVEEDGRRTRIVFSGDIGQVGSPLLNPPTIPDGVETLIMESTYGDRDHAPRDRAAADLKDVVVRAFTDGGKLIIPAFAVGRTQEVVYFLNKLSEAGELPPINVYVDSPLAVNVTEVFRLHPECYNKAMRDAIGLEGDGNPFGFKRLSYVNDVEASKRLNHLHGAAVIISASGMCEAGRILHHLRNHLPNPRNTVLFVGYQAEDTLGRKILDRQNPVPILGEEVRVAARIEQIESFSGHAGRTELHEWLQQVKKTGPLERVFLVHGEDSARRELLEWVNANGIAEVHAPMRGQQYDV